MRRNINQLICGATFGALLVGAWSAQAQGSDMQQDDMFLNFTRCYTRDSELPGPAATFGEDVCVTYEGTSLQTLRIMTLEDGTETVEWIVQQEGIATVRAQADDTVLDSGSFQIREIGEDLGDDAACLQSDAGDPAVQRASVETCNGGLGNLDFFDYRAEIVGGTFHTIHAGGQAGAWCGLIGNGQEFGTYCP